MNNNSEHSKLLEWVHSQGFPFEMRVASIFEKAGYAVQQSYYYPDPENGDYREIDLVCTLFKHKDFFTVCINFIIECKVASKYPWVLFTSDRVLNGFNLNFVYGAMRDNVRKRLVDFSLQDFDFDEKIPNFKKNGRIGFALVEGMKKGEDTAFKAVMSTVKAAFSYCERHRKDEVPPEIDISFPTIIIDGALYDCHLSEQGETEIEKVNSGILFQPRKIQGLLSPCLVVLSSSNLEEFATSQAKIMNSFLDELMISLTEKKSKE